MHDGNPLAGPPRRTPRRGRLRGAFAALLVATLTATAACQSDPAQPGAEAEKPTSGGTLNVLLGGQLEHLDPVQIYTTTAANVSRLVNRTLTTYKDEPGAAGSELVGDLATDIGTSPDGGKTWQFTLKKGILWEDGTPVVCAHVKYGIERRFAPEYTSGPTYARDYLAGTDGYKGPYVAGNNAGKGLASIECVDTQTVRFKLKQAVGDFRYTLAMQAFAPVPPEQDTHAKFDARPFSNGPYKVAQAFDGKGGPLLLERNGHWNPSTDTVRKAYPDKINFVIRENQDEEVTDELIKDTGEAKHSVALQQNVSPNFIQQVVNDPELKKRTIVGTVQGTTWVSINMNKVTDVRCRQALILATDKRRFRAMLGGSILGEYATTLIPPDLKGHKTFDVFGVGASEEGQPDKARALMDQAKADGKPCPRVLSVNFKNSKLWQRAVGTLSDALAQIDVQLKMEPFPTGVYYDSVSTQNKQGDLSVMSWLPDWPAASTVIPPLFDGRSITKDKTKPGNWNWPQLNDADVNKRVDAAMAETDVEKQAAMWGALDEDIQKKAVGIPILHPKILRLHGSAVHNAFLHPAFGEPDISAMWVG